MSDVEVDAVDNTKTLARLRVLSLIEGTTYLVLLLMAVLKRTSDFGIGTQIMGPIHGTIFLILAYALMMTYERLGWSFTKAVKAVVLGIVPLGAYWLERNWLRA